MKNRRPDQKKEAPVQPPDKGRPRSGLAAVRRELLGWGILLLAALTALGLSRASSGAVLTAWATIVRRLFGWGAFPVTVAAALVGLRLLWRELSDRLPLGPAAWVGLEICLLAFLTASHAPLVASEGSDAALVAAETGRAGGYIGWVLAVPLVGALGVAAGSFVLLVAFLFGVWLLVPVSWAEIRDWAWQQSRYLVAAWDRWWVARQGTPRAPEAPVPVSIPWWEQDEEPTEAGDRPATRKRAPTSSGTSRKVASHKQTEIRRRPDAGDLPPLDLLDAASPNAYGDADVRRKVQIIEETLASFGVPARVVEVSQGPTVTRFGLDPGFTERRGADGQVTRQRVRVARIAGLSHDLALALAASPIRIEAPVPGRSIVGLEVPNDKVALVSLRGVMSSDEFQRIKSPLAIALGESVGGEPVAVDLALMPHLLVAGATGSGKSVCVNAIICCLLLNNRPEDLKLLMIDHKMVELVGYNGIPHLLAPVVVNAEQVVGALAWLSRQMDDRYKLFHANGVRNLELYNRLAGRRKGVEPLPTLALFIDELADLMMVAPDEVERHLCRLAQMGRATGIHLVVATQRPSVDVVTGLIKANFPARVSFAVTSQVDSRVILDQGGAENLLGRGDMLFTAPQRAAPIRLQGCFVSDGEIERLTEFWRRQAVAPGYSDPAPPWTDMEEEEDGDGLLAEAARVVQGRERVSTSFLQRRLRIGFPRAARLMEQMEEQGLVGPDEGAGRGRQVLMGNRAPDES